MSLPAGGPQVVDFFAPPLGVGPSPGLLGGTTSAAEPAQELAEVSPVHAAVAAVVEVPQVARIAGPLAQGADQAAQVVRADVAVAVAVAE
jgi:hypothetical protein